MSTTIRFLIGRLFAVLVLLLLGGAVGYGLSDAITDVRRMLIPPSPKTEAAAAWNDFANRIGALGNRILKSDFPSGSDRDRAEGIKHLVHVMVEGLQWEFDHGGPKPASLMVSNTDKTAWGAPNVDNEYYRARIDPSSRYTLHGNVTSLHELAIQTSKGDIHQGQFGASETFDLSKLQIDEDGNFLLKISREPQEGDWLQPGEDHSILSIRTYLVDWESTAFGSFHLVEDDAEGLAPEPLSEAEAAARLGRSVNWIESNIVGWNRWFGAVLAAAEDNKALAPQFVEGGSSKLLYGGIPMRLPHGLALIIELDDPEADYFSFQTYRRGWYHPGDFVNHQTSLNQQQIEVGSDGKIRLVVSEVDPGVSNWLDTEGRGDGLIVFRYINSKKPQLPAVTVVPDGEVSSFFPGDTPPVTEKSRREAIAKRQRHIQYRSHN